ncbi:MULTISPECIES: rhomboid family intramembrane serine protease [Bacillus]|uniref:rhomboid family intramembrane serine protease n=1 Tax=Bacillus TaxID=1386 RepID=UPI0002FB46F0|nr:MULTISPECIES: rhomboid family intramembrane serine protease [Bacillus]
MFIRKESFKQFIKMYPVVTSIIGINMVVFILANLPLISNDLIISKMLGINLYIKEGQLWRLLTPIFLHSSLIHFIFNTFALIIFGPAIEQMIKSFRFFLLYVVSGIAANLITYFIQPLTYAHLGASGAIFGLLGFYLYLALFNSTFLSKQDVHMIKALTFIAFIMTFFQSNTNITAHISGYIIGFVLATVLSKKI